MELAFGEMGIMPHIFWELRPVDWHAMKRGFHRSIERQWDYTRHIMAAMGAGKGNPRKIMKLSFDEIPSVNAPTKAVAETIVQNLRRYLPTR